jgi:hypothetical protein
MNLRESHQPLELISKSGKHAVFFGRFHSSDRFRFYRVYRTDSGKTVRSGTTSSDPFKLLNALADRVVRYGAGNG